MHLILYYVKIHFFFKILTYFLIVNKYSNSYNNIIYKINVAFFRKFLKYVLLLEQQQFKQQIRSSVNIDEIDVFILLFSLSSANALARIRCFENRY